MTSVGEVFSKDGEKWILVKRPGFSGSNKPHIEDLRNRQYGENNWIKVWKYDGDILEFEDFCRDAYEEAYFQHAQDNPEIWNKLIKRASDVYDLTPDDVESGFDYGIQNAEATHIQDIAIRNVVRRLGKEFEGRGLVRIRGHYTRWGNLLSPGKVPFHAPEKIEAPLDEDYENLWWEPETVEDAYQRCKYLAVRAPQAHNSKRTGISASLS